MERTRIQLITETAFSLRSSFIGGKTRTAWLLQHPLDSQKSSDISDTSTLAVLRHSLQISGVDDDGATHHAHPARIGDSAGGCGREGNVILPGTDVHGNVEAGDDDTACAAGHLVAEHRERHRGAVLYVQDGRLEPRAVSYTHLRAHETRHD